MVMGHRTLFLANTSGQGVGSVCTLFAFLIPNSLTPTCYHKNILALYQPLQRTKGGATSGQMRRPAVASQDLLGPGGPLDCPRRLWNMDHGKKASWLIPNPTIPPESSISSYPPPPPPLLCPGPGIGAAGAATGGATGIEVVREDFLEANF